MAWILVVLCTATFFGCGRGSASGSGVEPTAAERLESSLTDLSVTADVRERRIAALGQPGAPAGVFPLSRALKHPSHVSFVLIPDDGHPLGYKAAELTSAGLDDRPMERLLAVCALERIGSYVALPDLLSVLSDHDHKVRAHAARACVRFGVREAPLRTLVALLDEKAYGNETANSILMDLFGTDLGFSADAGATRKAQAAARWRELVEDALRNGKPLRGEGAVYRMGMDPEADRRLRFLVDIVGQFQFKFQEEARLALSRLGAPGLAFLREAVEAHPGPAGAALRGGIARVLATIDAANSRELLDELARDEHPTVRGRAAEARGALGGAGATGAALLVLRDPEVSVRLAGLTALANDRSPESFAALRAFDSAGDANLEEARVASLFVATRGAEAKNEVLALLASPEPRARNRALAAVKAVLGPTVVFAIPGTAESRAADLARIQQTLAER